MMRLGRRTTPLVALFLLTSAATAHAECALVLWREEETKSPDRRAEVEWAAPIAYATRAACVAVIDANVDTWKTVDQQRQTVTRAASGTAAEFRTRFKDIDGWIATRLHCLPDTVDPRGPKGK
jgi:hypothetical protein